MRGFRIMTLGMLLEPVTDRCKKVQPDFSYPSIQVEQAAWRMLQERPVNLLNPRFQNYDELLAASLDALLADLERQGLDPATATWGDRNRVRIDHPLSGALPFLGRWLDIPEEELPGDNDMPRVQSPQHGASERLAVSPGHEEDGLFEMPGGQSGHFLSPFYRAGHESWAHGGVRPLLPGPVEHRLNLRPQ